MEVASVRTGAFLLTQAGLLDARTSKSLWTGRLGAKTTASPVFGANAPMFFLKARTTRMPEKVSPTRPSICSTSFRTVR